MMWQNLCDFRGEGLQQVGPSSWPVKEFLSLSLPCPTPKGQQKTALLGEFLACH